MYIQAYSPYHIYNQGNNKEVIFKEQNDYRYFLQRLKKWLCPVADIAAYCIMPNHFHILIFANENSIQTLKVGSLQLNELSNAFRLCQSQYAQYFNKKYNHVGAVFRPKIKSKVLDGRGDQVLDCFHYIHNNPQKAGLVNEPWEWIYSSFNEIKSANVDLVNLEIVRKYVVADF